MLIMLVKNLSAVAVIAMGAKKPTQKMEGDGGGLGNTLVHVTNEFICRLPSPPGIAMHWYLDKGIMYLSSDSMVLIGSPQWVSQCRGSLTSPLHCAG